MIKIEEPREEHIDDIFGLSATICKEFDKPIYFTRDSVVQSVADAKKDSVFARVILYDGIVVGYFIAFILDRMHICQIEHIVLHKRFRGAFLFLKMYLQIRQWAQEKGCQLLLISGISITKDYAMRLGFVQEYTFYGKEITCPQQ